MKSRKLIGVIVGALMLLACYGCSSSPATSSAAASTSSAATGTKLASYTAVYAVYNAGAAQKSGNFTIDTSSVANGYVAATGISSSRLKCQIKQGDITYNYDLPNDGTAAIYPLQSGDGSYTIRIMQNTSANKYVEAFATTASVVMKSQFEPFLRQNQIVDYSADSACVKLANKLRGESATDIELAGKIYDYITEHVDYDYEKADTVQDGYVPDPDSTLASGKGICYDYASLAAAMLRSQGIPTKLITGYVTKSDYYHAWDIIYFESTGWVSIEVKVEKGQWTRIDTTRAAADGGLGISADDTYTDRYTY